MSQLQVSGEAKIRDIQGPVVANSGVITALDGAASQYVRGDGTLADFPTSTGGGSSVSYYLNGSVNQGTFGGSTYYEMSKSPIIGAGTDFPVSTNGLVAQFITDANDPDLLEVPGGNFNLEFYFSVSNNTGNPTVYAELYKYDGTTFTLLGSSVAVPESLNQGTTIAPYYFAIPVATAALALTDRIAIRIYANVDGRTVTLHTENSHLCQVVTTFSKGMVSLNNLTDQSQFITTGTSGTNFNIVSSGDTHTFNLPVASATNTGKLSNTDWSTFNNKQAALSFTAPLDNTANTISIPAATSLVDGYLDNLDWVKFNTAYNDSIISAAVTGTTTKTLTLNQQDGGTITASWTDDNTDAVTSVFGRTGAVVAVSGDYNTSQVTENTNLYFTNARSRAALSFSAGSGAYNSTTGVITIPTNNNQITNGAGYITSSALSAYLPLTGGTLTGNVAISVAPSDSVGEGCSLYLSGGTGSSYTYLQQGVGQFLIFAYNGSGWNTNLSINSNNGNSVFRGTLSASNFSGSSSGTNTGDQDLSGYVTLGTAQTISGAKTFTSNIQLGAIGIGSSTATPKTINLGDTFSDTAGTNLKLRLFEASDGSVYGIGVSGSQMDFNLPADAQYKFWSGNAVFVKDVTALSFTKSGGTSSQFLKANGSIDSNTYLTTVNAATTYLSLSGGTLTNTGSTKLYIEGGSSQNGISFGSLLTGTANAFYIFNGTYGLTQGFGIYNNTSSTMPFFIFNNGNIGLSTTTDAGYKLDVSGSGRFSSTLTSNNIILGSSGVRVTSFGYLTQTISGEMTILGHNIAASTSVGNQVNVVNGSWYSSMIKQYYNEGITFHTSDTSYAAGAIYPMTSTERMRVTSIGNILIGTQTGVSGGGTLQVNGNVNINGVFQINGTTIGGGGGSGITGSGTSGNLTKWTGASTVGNSVLTETSGGRLIQGSGDGFLITTGSSNSVGGGSFLALANSGTTRWILQQINASFGLDWWSYNGSSWAQRMTLTAGGNLGLGTTSPTTYGIEGTHFEINSNATSYSFLHVNTGSVKAFLASDAPSFVTVLFTYSNHALCLGTNNTERIRITETTGNLLIGTVIDAGAGYKLQVNGSISMAYASFFNFRGSSGAGDVLVDNSGSALRITGNVSVAGSVTATGGFFDTSDSRLKILVKDYEQPKGIENVTARMYVKNNRKELGYYAQDLQEILPSAVSEGSDGFLTLSYSQVHTAKIAYLEEKVAQLEELIKTLL